MTIVPHTGEVLAAPRRKIDEWVDILPSIVEFSKIIATTEFCPVGLRGHPDKVTAAITLGRELDLPPVTTLASIYVVHGRPGLSAETMRALVHGAGHEYRVLESSATRCVISGRRRQDADDPDAWQTFSFTLEEARQAGLAGRDTWKAWPTEMLLARATTRMCRAVFPDVLHGLRSAEELEDMEPAPKPAGTVTIDPPARTRRKRTPAAEVVAPAPTPELPKAPAPERVGSVEEFEAAVAAKVAEPAPAGEPSSVDGDPDRITRAQQRKLMALAGRLHLDDRSRLSAIGRMLGRRSPDGKAAPIETTNDLTSAEASIVLDILTEAADRGDQPETLRDVLVERGLM